MSRVMELVAPSGSPDLQLHSSAAWPPSSSPKHWTIVKRSAASQLSGKPEACGKERDVYQQLWWALLQELRTLWVLKRSIFKRRQYPGLHLGLLQRRCSRFDLTFRLETDGTV